MSTSTLSSTLVTIVAASSTLPPGVPHLVPRPNMLSLILGLVGALVVAFAGVALCLYFAQASCKLSFSSSLIFLFEPF
ncbi:hypothetical protein CPB83DRAFT_290715 [Crepidotus variabilis]|uniref:Uncharacterized protein n=1 Tax=Crepidotus variabilis TaxID=179855 RepID=A0A9P6EHE0_9AGAR|nr:hypothetical protein CPB83DRAFT_290715 [Crepidotus variabilis]